MHQQTETGYCNTYLDGFEIPSNRKFQKIRPPFETSIEVINKSRPCWNLASGKSDMDPVDTKSSNLNPIDSE